MSNLFDNKGDPYGSSFDEADFDQLPPEDIVAYNELRSVSDLYRLHKTKQLNIQPDFQREHVWKDPQKTRFIDSLYKRFPIPSMCIADNYKKNEMIVIDGLQRISSIISLLDENSDFKLSTLEDVDNKLSGQQARAIRNNPSLISKIENVSIPITIIRCDLEKTSHNEYIFQIFHRLNKGGVTLNNQEIRNCIYRGELNDLLFDLYKDPKWLEFIGRPVEVGDRFKGQELILRFFAMHNWIDKYEGRLSQFLNDFMKAHKNFEGDLRAEFRTLFLEVLNIVSKMDDPPNSIVLREGLLFGVSRNLNLIKSKNYFDINVAYNSMLNSPEFDPLMLKEGLSRKDNLIKRLLAAEKSIRDYANACS